MWTHILCIAANIINVDNLLDNLSHHFELMRGQLECEEEGASTFFLAGLSPPTTGQKPGGEQSVLVESREQAPTADMQGPTPTLSSPEKPENDCGEDIGINSEKEEHDDEEDDEEEEHDTSELSVARTLVNFQHVSSPGANAGQDSFDCQEKQGQLQSLSRIQHREPFQRDRTDSTSSHSPLSPIFSFDASSSSHTDYESNIASKFPIEDFGDILSSRNYSVNNAQAPEEGKDDSETEQRQTNAPLSNHDNSVDGLSPGEKLSLDLHEGGPNKAPADEHNLPIDEDVNMDGDRSIDTLTPRPDSGMDDLGTEGQSRTDDDQRTEPSGQEENLRTRDDVAMKGNLKAGTETLQEDSRGGGPEPDEQGGDDGNDEEEHEKSSVQKVHA